MYAQVHLCSDCTVFKDVVTLDGFPWWFPICVHATAVHSFGFWSFSFLICDNPVAFFLFLHCALYAVLKYFLVCDDGVACDDHCGLGSDSRHSR